MKIRRIRPVRFAACRLNTGRVEQSERIGQFNRDHELRIARFRARIQPNQLQPDRGPIDMDELYGPTKMCFVCHK